MKKYCLLFSCLLFWMCKKEQVTEPETNFSISEPCDWITTVTPPKGFNLEKISTIEDRVGLRDIQMLDDQTGYILAGNNVGGFAEVYKTIDGGASWNDLALTIEKSPRGMFFLDEDIGWVSFYNNQGKLIKTVDGGATWESVNFPEFNGYFTHFAQNAQGTLFAMLFGLNIEASILKSEDQGESWQVFFADSPVDHSIFRSGFQLTDTHIFITTESQKLVIVDFEGDQIASIDLPVDWIWDLDILDNDNFVLVGNGKVLKSNDSGATWEEIHPEIGRIIEFSSLNEGWMVLNKSGCPTDVYQVMDVWAHTEDSGATWQESEVRTNLMVDYNKHYRKTNGDFLIIFEKDIFVLSER